MIVAPQPEAVEAGALVLQRGGNAIDAAITCAMVQTVVDPQMAGIAGFGTLQAFMPGRGVHECIDFHARCPASARPDMWAGLVEGETRDGFGFILKGRVNDVGYQSIAVPGSLKGFAEALESFGTMDWADVVQPAIDQCHEGVVIRPHLYSRWVQNDAALGRLNYEDKLRFTESGRRIYCHPDGSLRRPGQRLHNPDMLRTLQRIARHGPDDFYQGEIADEIDADMRAQGGLLRRADLKAYRTRRTRPLWGQYRGTRIAAPQPPGGGVVVLEILHILEHFDLRRLGHNTPEHLHVMVEAQKCATIDKDAHVGDPEYVDVPLDRLLGPDHSRDAAAAIRAGRRAHVPRMASAESRDTTTVSVADAAGNVVVMTHSLGAPSGVITPGLGFMFNGCMAVFDPRPGRTGSIAGGKSRFASMAPSIVFRGDRPYLALGAPGGTQITLAIAQVISNVLDFDMSILEAICAPRACATSDIVDISNRIPRYVSDRLEAMGYAVARSHLSYAFAAVHGIMMADGRLSGAADPQRDGMALLV
ncbi:MAG: gamma-glutamyltransferase family protein [Gemmatimonadaceae bacterium]|nr:gamma-glutamyltransferase family protein [Acetobacteraceae bacterium]